MTASNWSEEEWSVTLQLAERDPHRVTGMMGEPREECDALPLGEGDIDALYLQVERERRMAEYNARAVDWVMERISGRNTP